MQVNRDAFRTLPYLAFDDLGDRVVNLMPMWDGNDWHYWLPHEGRIIKMQMFGVVVGEYLAKQPEAPTDLWISLVEFAWQRASWPELSGLWRHLTDDIHNFATCVAKLEYFVAQRDVIGLGASAFVQTELEYLLVLARSVFDLLQELVARFWTKRVSLIDPTAEADRRRHKLPTEFSKIVLRDKCEVRSAEEIAGRFPVSPTLARAYSSAGAFFFRLRSVRDTVVHGGRSFDLIFMSERGPCIHRTAPILAALGLCAVPDVENENVVSLWPVIAHVVFGTLAACDGIVEALACDVSLPPALAPEYSVSFGVFIIRHCCGSRACTRRIEPLLLHFMCSRYCVAHCRPVVEGCSCQACGHFIDGTGCRSCRRECRGSRSARASSGWYRP